MRTLFFLFCTLLASCPFLNAQTTTEHTKALDAIFADFDQTEAGGLAVSVRHRGEVVYERGFGTADARTPFAIGELSNTFVAQAIFLLEDAGKIKLTDPVREYLPELHHFGERVFIHHLLSRSGGFWNAGAALAVQGAGPEAGTDVQRVLRLLSRQSEPLFPPGTEFSNHDAGLLLLKEIISRVSEQTYAEYCSENIFRPLGMTNSHFVNGQLYVSAADWSRWETALTTPAYARLGEPARLDDGHAHHGLAGGLFLHQQLYHLERGVPKFYRTGREGKYTSSVFRFPDTDFSVVVLSDNNMPYNGHLGMGVAYHFLEETLTEPAVVTFDGKETVPASAARLSPLAGSYWSELEALSRELVFENDTLFYLRGRGRFALVELRPNYFQLDSGTDDQIFLNFTTDAESTHFGYSSGGSDPLQFTKYQRVDPALVEPKDFRGTYYCDLLGVGKEVTVTEAGQLQLGGSHHGPVDLAAYREDRFSGNHYPWWNLEFYRDSAGRVGGFELDVRGLRGLNFRLLPAG